MKEKIIVELQKDSTFQMRINSEIKSSLEELYGKCGLTMTDAVNCFFQQSLNQGGMPIMMTNNESFNRLFTYLEKLSEIESQTQEVTRKNAMKAFMDLRTQARKDFPEGMSIEEIDEEIRKAQYGID